MSLLPDMPEKPACDCVECRIRAAYDFHETAPVDTLPVILALGNVLSELLAYVPSKQAKQAAAELLVTRKEWQKHPRVAAQQEPAGHA